MSNPTVASDRRKRVGNRFESPVATAQLALCEAQARIDRAHSERVRAVVALQRKIINVENEYLRELRAIKSDLAAANVEMLRETA